eukprot:TRINITY_DN1516_c0_g1_i1.p1 TRINITY_DN1516_c0_g1~~TRINITY_DN1516_c0_g1_i1.p1  ORF type:complete len:220 (-),score=48.46 TRINITY_DN1516_c0_g1_i1:56-715(-)
MLRSLLLSRGGVGGVFHHKPSQPITTLPLFSPSFQHHHTPLLFFKYYSTSSSPSLSSSSHSLATPNTQQQTNTLTLTPSQQKVHELVSRDHKPTKPHRNYPPFNGKPIANSFAVIHVCGKQYKVTKGDVIMCDYLEVDVADKILFDKVLMVGTKDFTSVGTPVLRNAKVEGTIEELTKTEKQIVFKKRRRKNSQRTKGHRSDITMIRIGDVLMTEDTSE